MEYFSKFHMHEIWSHGRQLGKYGGLKYSGLKSEDPFALMPTWKKVTVSL